MFGLEIRLLKKTNKIGIGFVRCAIRTTHFLKGDNTMLETLKKILEQEKEEKEKKKLLKVKQSEKDYFFDKEWELLKAQRGVNDKGEKK